MSSIGSYFNPDTPEFVALRRKAREYFKNLAEKAKQLTLTGEPIKLPYGFGRFSGLAPDIPTLNELAITQYLDYHRIPYQLHTTFKELFPLDEETKEHPDIEYDIYLPKGNIAIEVSPAFHSAEHITSYLATGKSTEGRKNLARVLRNDQLKAEMARKHGIVLLSIDPTDDINTFSERINDELVPALRSAGYHVSDLFVQPAQSRAIAKATKMSRRFE